MRDYAEQIERLRECASSNHEVHSKCGAYLSGVCAKTRDIRMQDAADAIEELLKRPEIPETGIGDLSDGYHTFNGLYYQRMILFAALVRAYKDRAWKSFRHEDGELCFGGGWFIVGIDTLEGSYTYHYENVYFDYFDCVELPNGKHWDGHTEDDVTRLLSLPTLSHDEVRGVGEWIPIMTDFEYQCSKCGKKLDDYVVASEWAGLGEVPNYCPNCGAKMEVSEDA